MILNNWFEKQVDLRVNWQFGTAERTQEEQFNILSSLYTILFEFLIDVPALF